MASVADEVGASLARSVLVCAHPDPAEHGAGHAGRCQGPGPCHEDAIDLGKHRQREDKTSIMQ